MSSLGNRTSRDTPDVKTLYEALCRYTDCRNRERHWRLVRADVETLETAIEGNSDPLEEK